MRFLILNTDYPAFLGWLYAQHPGLEKRPYEEQMRARNGSLFGVADFYSGDLLKLGHEAYDIHANNEFMQRAWSKEYGLAVPEPSKWWREALQRVRRMAARSPLRRLKWFFRPVLRALDRQQSWYYDILAAQIKHYKPDVVLNQAIEGIESKFMKEMRPHLRLLIGQQAATQPADDADFSCYDFMISSFPPTLDYFRGKGIRAYLNRMGFEPRVLSWLKPQEETFDVTFIGSLSSVHSSRVELLETLCKRFHQLKIWAPGIEHLPSTYLIRNHYVEQVWGLQMYQILRCSKITLNHHGDVAPYANNMRLYEATGVGSLLITDWKENLHEMFEVEKEVVAYRTPEECAELIQYYLEHDEERRAIARAGQERTLREHSYQQRMQELVDIVRKHI
jgi:spore maturation protein CgeB